MSGEMTLSYLVSHLVSDLTKQRLRNSSFNTKCCFDEAICEEARNEFVDEKARLDKYGGTYSGGQQYNKKARGGFQNNSNNRPRGGGRSHHPSKATFSTPLKQSYNQPDSRLIITVVPGVTNLLQRSCSMPEEGRDSTGNNN